MNILMNLHKDINKKQCYLIDAADSVIYMKGFDCCCQITSILFGS